MPTYKANLSTAEYVKVNTSQNSVVLQSLRDSVRIALSSVKPTKSNEIFHILNGGDAPLPIHSPDVDIWALALTDRASLVISELDPAQMSLYDGVGNPIGSYRGALNTHDADVHNEIINRRMHRHTGLVTTLTADTAGNDAVYQIPVADSTGFAVGDYIHINTTTIELTHPKITAISAPTGPATFTLDRRLNYAHVAGDTVEKAVIDMSSLAGSMASPVVYFVQPYGTEVWHIERLLFEITHGTAGDLGLFGNLEELQNGVVLRAYVNGQYSTFTNWKRNSHMKTDMYDVQFDPRSGGGGSYGTTGRGTFKSAGAVVRLDAATNDRLELVVQDDITALDSFTMNMQGHFEGL